MIIAKLQRETSSEGGANARNLSQSVVRLRTRGGGGGCAGF
jgi:hypothetical protein